MNTMIEGKNIHAQRKDLFRMLYLRHIYGEKGGGRGVVWVFIRTNRGFLIAPTTYVGNEKSGDAIGQLSSPTVDKWVVGI